MTHVITQRNSPASRSTGWLLFIMESRYKSVGSETGESSKSSRRVTSSLESRGHEVVGHHYIITRGITQRDYHRNFLTSRSPAWLLFITES